MIIHLGVVDLPYNGKGGSTTGDVAEILEAKYHVMGNFVALHLPEIVEVTTLSVTEALDSLMMGAPATLDPFGQAVQDINQLFTTYLDNEEIAQTGQAGVPTQAALDGVRSGFKKIRELKGKIRSRTRSTRRQSFIDTGLYRNSFKAWVR